MEQTEKTALPTTTSGWMAQKARAVQKARALYADCKADMDKERVAFEESFASQIALVKETGQTLALCESDLREYAIGVYLETGEKHPGAGVNIRDIVKLQYDGAEALKWAKHHDVALALDKATFEKIAKVTPPEFVRTVIEHQATIATDLDKALRDEVDAA